LFSFIIALETSLRKLTTDSKLIRLWYRATVVKWGVVLSLKCIKPLRKLYIIIINSSLTSDAVPIAGPCRQLPDIQGDKTLWGKKLPR
jgi:hypothetical protein